MSNAVEIPAETLAAFGGDELRARIWYEKYALRGPDDEILEATPEYMWRRVAREIASAESTPELRTQWEREFYWLLEGFRFLPGGRILHGAGNPRKITLINCFYERIAADSLEAIYTTAMHAAKTYSRGGGIGIDVTPLRGRGMAVHNAARTSTGAVSFMELFSLTTGLIGQHGRRGALMLTIADHHPDVLEFCRIKRDLTSVRFANISVKLTDAFMRAVEQDGPWTLWFEGPEVGRVERVLRARELWDELVAGARDWAEPGCLFWDIVKRMGTSEYNGMHVEGCNPCSEQVLGHGDCCDLGSINLAKFVLDPFTPESRVDGEALRRAVRAAVRFLDNVHEYSLQRHLYPLPHQEDAARRGRRVGAGITGLGDMLIQLGLRYDADQAIEFAGNLMADIKHTAYGTSVELAKEKGPFPAFDADQHLSQAFFSTFPEELVEAIRRHGLRNVSLLTIPPVGSGSALAGCTNGLEPIFALTYIRRSESLSQEYFHVLHPLVAEYAASHGLLLADLQSAADPHEYLRAQLPPEFVVSHEINPLKRVDMQAALQRHVDQAISSTVNLPREATTETVEQVYFHGWRSGLKGISVYRESSRQGILLTPEEAKRSHALVALSERVTAIAREVAPTLAVNGAGSPEQQIELVTRALADLVRQHPEQLQLIGEDDSLLDDRPECLSGFTYRIPTAFGTAFVDITERDGEPYEIFARLGKAGSDAEADAEGLGRLCSVILRLRRRRGDGERIRRLQLIIEQLEGIGGSRQYGFGPNRVSSIPDAIAVALRKYMAARHEVQTPNVAGETISTIRDPELAAVAGACNGNLCPRCLQRSLVTTEGCTKCRACGFQEC